MGPTIRGNHEAPQEGPEENSTPELLMEELTEGRYRELLNASPQMSMEDVERLKDFEPSLSAIASSILVAYPMQRMTKRAAKKAKAFAAS